MNPGEQSEIRIFLQNNGLQRVDDISFTLLPSGYLVDIMQSEAYLGASEPDQVVSAEVSQYLLMEILLMVQF